MTAQWIRKASLIVGDDESALDLSQLHFRFQIRQQDIQVPNSADIRVYNVSDATAKRARDLVEGGSVVISAGYDGNFGVIFRGSIIQVRTGKESPVDSYIDITAGDGDRGYTLATLSKTLAAGSTVKDHIAAGMEAMGPYGVKRGWMPDDLPKNPLPRAKVMFGMARDVLEDAARTAGADWTIHDGALNVIDQQAFLPGEVVVLTSATGLIGMPEQQIDGIRIRSLLNPSIVAGRVVQINNKSLQELRMPLDLDSVAKQYAIRPKLDADGYYRTIVVDHVGDTRGQEWYSDIIAVGLNEPITNALIPRQVIADGV